VHRLFATASVAAILAGPLALPAAAEHLGPTISVDGSVATPATYTLAELAALPQTTATVTTPSPRGARQHIEEGVTLETLVIRASPTLPQAKNALLRVVITVSGEDRSRTFALGELDPNFGNHGALLAIKRDGKTDSDGPELVVPADSTAARYVHEVRRVTVAVESPAPTKPVSSGAVDLITRGQDEQLTAADLAALPAQTLNVTFVAGSGTQDHTETGPTVAAVLEAARVHSGPDTWVAAVGSDGYVATVTPAEAIVGGRPLLISTVEDGNPLAQPRLVADGDVKGGRYVSDIVDLVAGRDGPGCVLVYQPASPIGVA
jgi:hypothetical protein